MNNRSARCLIGWQLGLAFFISLIFAVFLGKSMGLIVLGGATIAVIPAWLSGSIAFSARHADARRVLFLQFMAELLKVLSTLILFGLALSYWVLPAHVGYLVLGYIVTLIMGTLGLFVYVR